LIIPSPSTMFSALHQVSVLFGTAYVLGLSIACYILTTICPSQSASDSISTRKKIVFNNLKLR
ncbi:MAG: hypothetical protein ACK53Y_02980, partial [bacterium]